MSVSVILPTIWRPSLVDSIESVLNQSYPIAEIIVISGIEYKCDSAAAEIMKNYKNINFIFSKTGMVSENRNIGLDFAFTEYVAFLDDDDIWLPDKIEIQMRAINSNNADICITSASFGDKNSYFRKAKELVEGDQILLASYDFWNPFKRKPYIPFPTVLINREKIGKVRFDVVLSEREDLWFLHELQLSGLKACYSQQVTAVIKKSKPFVNRNFDFQQELVWCSRLELLKQNLGLKFLINTSIRNSLATGHFKAVFQLVKVAGSLGLSNFLVMIGKWKKRRL